MRTVKKRLADGTVKTYRYASHRPRHAAADTIGALVEAYRRSPEFGRKHASTRAADERGFKYLSAFWPLQVAEFKRRVVFDLRDELANDRGPAAANRFVRSVASLFAWAARRDRADHNPTLGIDTLPGGEWRAWTAAEFERIVPALPECLRRAAVLARYTGQRRADLIAMKWSAYDGEVIRLRQQKTGVALVIPVSSELRTELDTWRAGPVVPLPERTILTTPSGTPWTGMYLSQALGRALVGVDRGLNMHGFRKLAAAELAEAGCSEKEIAAITGHRTLAMVQHYTKSADQERLALAAVNRRSNRGKLPG